MACPSALDPGFKFDSLLEEQKIPEEYPIFLLPFLKASRSISHCELMPIAELDRDWQ